MNCIQQRRIVTGRGAELGANHTRFCTYCEEDATHHVTVGYWCGNTCERCGRKVKSVTGRVADVVLEEGTFVVTNGGEQA
jgi:hypothetical protein